MDSIRDALSQNAAASLAIGGLVIGFAFGFIVFRTNFCTMGSISDFVSFGDFRRFRAWVLAAGVAIIGAQLLQRAGILDMTKSMYLTTSFDWFGNILGGLMFGFGMVLGGGCVSRNIARAGGGDLRSLLTLLVTGLFAYMTIGGLLGPARFWLSQHTSFNLGSLKMETQSLGAIFGPHIGLTRVTADTVFAALLGGVALAYCFSDRAFRHSPMHILSGVGVGVCVLVGWALTGLSYDEMSVSPTPVISLTYVRPAGDTVDWLQRFTAGRIPGFGVATVLGAVLGAFVAAMLMRRFRVATYSHARDTLRNLGGAALMGTGGVMALGCTVGQGVTGVSTLALGSYLAVSGIIAGGMAGIKYMEWALKSEI